MDNHSRSLGGMNILIYGKDPLMPMKLEQALATAKPADEVLIDSFENYDQAYNFCKDNKNVGLVFLFENCGEMDVNSVFTQFQKLNEYQDTCFAVLLHNGMETIKGLRASKDNDSIIGYYNVNDLLDLNKTSFFMQEIWEKYQTTFEKILIPSILASTYKTIAQKHLPTEILNFGERLSVLLSGEMNVTWKESLMLKWSPVLKVLKENDQDLIKGNKQLFGLYQIVESNQNSSDLKQIAESELEIAKKISTTVQCLISSMKENKLEMVLQNAIKEVTPRSKALLRILKRRELNILEMAKASDVTTKVAQLKVV